MTAPERFYVREIIVMEDGQASTLPVGNHLLSDPDKAYLECIPAHLVDALVAEAVAKERERCAGIADKCAHQNGPLSSRGFDERYRAGLEAGAQAIAAAIRAGKGE